MDQNVVNPVLDTEESTTEDDLENLDISEEDFILVEKKPEDVLFEEGSVMNPEADILIGQVTAFKLLNP